MLKQVSELMIYGDKTNDRFFEYFCEKGFLALFNRVMRETREARVQKQVLQSIMILMQNISNERSLFYLLSNNHINALLAAPFDAADEELLAYHVSLIKALSLQLNSATVHFFYNERARLIGFPLYTQAIKYMSHPDAMVQTAVRTTTLNVFRVPEPSVRTFVASGARLQFFDRLAFCAGQHVLNLNQRVAEAVAASKGWELRMHTASRRDGSLRSGGTPSRPPPSAGVIPPLSPTMQVAGTCEHYTLRAFASPQGARGGVVAAMTAVADSWQALSDLLYYIGDIFTLGDATVSKAMSLALMRRFIRPLLLHSLTAAKCVVNERLQAGSKKRAPRTPPLGVFRTPPRGATGASKEPPSAAPGSSDVAPPSPPSAKKNPPHHASLNPLSSYHGLQPLSLAAAADGVPPHVRVHPDPAPPWMPAAQRAATLRRLPQVSGYPQGMAPPPLSRAVVLDTAVTLHVTNAVLHAMPCSDIADPLCSWLLSKPLVPHSAWTEAACSASAAAVPAASPAAAAARLPAHKPSSSTSSVSSAIRALASVPEDLDGTLDEKPLLITLPPLQPPLFLCWSSCREPCAQQPSSSAFFPSGIGEATSVEADGTCAAVGTSCASATGGGAFMTASANSRTLSLFGEESSSLLSNMGPSSPRGPPAHRSRSSDHVALEMHGGGTASGGDKPAAGSMPKSRTTSAAPQLRTGRDLLLVLSCLPDTRVSQAAVSLLWTLTHGGGDPDLAQAPLSPSPGEDEEGGGGSPHPQQGGLIDALKGGAWLSADGNSGTPQLPGSPPPGRFFPSAWSSAADFGDTRFVSGELLRGGGLEESRRSRAGLLLTSLTHDEGGAGGATFFAARSGSTAGNSTPLSRHRGGSAGSVASEPPQQDEGQASSANLVLVEGGNASIDPLTADFAGKTESAASSPGLHSRHNSTTALDDRLPQGQEDAGGDGGGNAADESFDAGRSPRFQSDPGPTSAYDSLQPSTLTSSDSPLTGQLTPLYMGDREGGSVFSGAGGTSAWGGGSVGDASVAMPRRSSVLRRLKRVSMESLLQSSTQAYSADDWALNETVDTMLSALTSAAGGSTAMSGGGKKGLLRGLATPPPTPILGNQPFISVRRGVSALRRLLLPATVRSIQRVAAYSRAEAIACTFKAVQGQLRASSPGKELPADAADVLLAAQSLCSRLESSSRPAPVLTKEQATTLVRAAEQSAALIRSVLRQPSLVGGLQSAVLLIEAGTACYLRSREYADAVSTMHTLAPLARDVLECHASMAHLAEAANRAAPGQAPLGCVRGTLLNPDVVQLSSALADALAQSPRPVRVLVSDVTASPDAAVLGSDTRQQGACSALWADSLGKASQDLGALWTWRDQGLRMKPPSKMFKGGLREHSSGAEATPSPPVQVKPTEVEQEVQPGEFTQAQSKSPPKPLVAPLHTFKAGEAAGTEQSRASQEQESAVNAQAVPAASAVLDDAFDGNSSDDDRDAEGGGPPMSPPSDAPRSRTPGKRSRRIPLRMNEPSSRPWLKMGSTESGGDGGSAFSGGGEGGGSSDLPNIEQALPPLQRQERQALSASVSVSAIAGSVSMAFRQPVDVYEGMLVHTSRLLLLRQLMMVQLGGGRVWWDPPAALLYASVDQHSALRGNSLQEPRNAVPFKIPPHITQPAVRSKMHWAFLPSVAESMHQPARTRAVKSSAATSPTDSAAGSVTGSAMSTPRFPHLNAFSSHRERTPVLSPRAAPVGSPSRAAAGHSPELSAEGVLPPAGRSAEQQPPPEGIEGGAASQLDDQRRSPALASTAGSMPASPSPLRTQRRGPPDTADSVMSGAAQVTLPPDAAQGVHPTSLPSMDMGPPALPLDGRTFSDISSVSKRDRTGTNDSLNTMSLFDPGHTNENGSDFIDASGLSVPTVRLGDPLLPLLTYTQQEKKLSAGDSFPLDGLFCTPVLQYTEAVLPASDEQAARMNANARGKSGAGSFPGPTIALFGHAFPAQQLLAVLGESVLVLAKAMSPTGMGSARGSANSVGSHRVRHSLQARYGAPRVADEAHEAAAANSAAGQAMEQPQAMALCVIPVHMLSTRWLEVCGNILELRCISLGRIPLMSTLPDQGGSRAAESARPVTQACTLQCASPEAALALRRRLLRASLSRLSARHGAAAALVQQPLLAAAGEVCWRGDLMLRKSASASDAPSTQEKLKPTI